MEYRPLGTRYEGMGMYDIVKHQPYNYKKHGLLKTVMPAVIINTKNKTTKLILDFVEAVQLFLLSYVDELKQIGRADKLTEDNQRLRDTNHQLFTRVTGGSSPSVVEGPEISPEESAEDAFNQLIKDGML